MTNKQEWLKLRKKFDLVRKDKLALERLVKNFCYAFLVDYKGRPLKLPPMQIQIVIECLSNRYLMLLSPRGSGKSKALSVAVTIWIYFYRSGEKVGVVAPQMKQCKIIFNDVVENIRTSPMLSEFKFIKTLRTENEPILIVDGGSVVQPYPAETKREGQSIRGFHATFCVVDESPSIPDHLFDANIEPIVLANRAPFINIGTPKTKDNHTYKYLYDDRYKHFKRLRFTYKHAMVKGDAYETPWSEEDIEIKKKTWGEDSIKFKTEYLCEFIEESGQFFISNDFTFYKLKHFVRNPKELKGDTFITVDLARRHNSVVIALWEAAKKGDMDVLLLRDLKEIRPPKGGIDPRKLRGELINYGMFYKARGIVLDATGSGTDFVSDLKHDARTAEYSVKIIPFIFDINKAAQYSMYKMKLISGEILIPKPSSMTRAHERRIMDRCMEQHFNISYSFAKDLKHVLIRSEKHRHDDFPDCMCMAPLLMGKVKHTTTVLGAKRDKSFIPDKNEAFHSHYAQDYSNDFDKEKYGGGIGGQY